MEQVSQAVYHRIVVEGELDPIWRESLGGLAITEQSLPGMPVITRLEGSLADQSALQGVLDTLFMLGMRLILVERFEQGASNAAASNIKVNYETGE
jgi:hypothetical protein